MEKTKNFCIARERSRVLKCTIHRCIHTCTYVSEREFIKFKPFNVVSTLDKVSYYCLSNIFGGLIKKTRSRPWRRGTSDKLSPCFRNEYISVLKFLLSSSSSWCRHAFGMIRHGVLPAPISEISEYFFLKNFRNKPTDCMIQNHLILIAYSLSLFFTSFFITLIFLILAHHVVVAVVVFQFLLLLLHSCFFVVVVVILIYYVDEWKLFNTPWRIQYTLPPPAPPLYFQLLPLSSSYCGRWSCCCCCCSCCCWCYLAYFRFCFWHLMR